MKTRSFAIALLFGLCGVCQSFAKTVLRLPESSSSYPGKGESFQMVFDRAVVKDAQVGQAAEAGVADFKSKDGKTLKLDSKWIAPNVLECTLQQNLPFRSVYEWAPKKKLRFADGKPVPHEPLSLVGAQCLKFNVYAVEGGWLGSYVKPWESFVVVIPDVVPELKEKSAAPVEAAMTPPDYQSWQEALGNSICLVSYADKKKKTDPDEMRVEAAYLHCATLKEMKDCAHYRIRSMATEWLDKGYAQDMPLPGVFIVQATDLLRHGRTYYLLNNNVGLFSTGHNGDEDKKAQLVNLGRVKTFQVDTADYSVSDEGARSFTLGWNLPVHVPNVRKFFAEHLELSPHSAADKIEYDRKKGRYVMTLDYKSKTPRVIYIEPDEKALKEAELIRPEWRTSLPMVMTGDEDVFRLNWKFKDVKSVDGQLLSSDPKEDYIQVRPNLPSLYLDAGNNGILYTGGRKMKAAVESMQTMTVRGFRIKPEARRHTYEAYRKIYVRDDETSLPDSATDKAGPHLLQAALLSADKTGQLEVDVKGKREAALSLDELFGAKVAPGMYFIEVEARVSAAAEKAMRLFNDYRGLNPSYAAQSLVQVTDLGLLHKKTSDSLFAYVYSLSTGKALNRAQLKLLDKTGAELVCAPVENGAVVVPLRGLKTAPAFALVSAGEDSYLTPISDYDGRVSLWRFDVDTLPYAWDVLDLNPATTAQVRTFMFSDRNLYRPGETMRLKGIVRSMMNNKLSLVPVESLTLTVSKGGRDLLNKQVEVSAEGTFDVDFEFPQEETGTYRVKAELRLKGDPAEGMAADNGEDKSWWKEAMWNLNRKFDYYVEVAEFKRNEFEVTTKQDPLAPGQMKLKGNLSAVNFTGTPVANAEVRWSLVTEFSNFYPKNYAEYRFGDHRETDSGYWQAYYGYSYGSSLSTAWQSLQGKLNAEGKAAVEFELKNADFPQVRHLHLIGSVTNGNEQTLSSSSKAVWYPAEVFVGVKSASSICRQGTPLDLRLIALTPQGLPFDGYGLGVDVKVTRTAFRPLRYESDSGTTVRNDKQTSTVLEENITICPEDSVNRVTGGKLLNIPTAQDGIYEVTLSGKDAAGREFRTAVTYRVYGGDVSPWEYHDGLKVDIVPDKQLYKPGDTARLLVQTPIEGEVVVTVEREGVMRHYTRKLTLTDPVVEIPLEDADAPNVYASVFLVKGAELSGRKAMNPQLKLGYATLNVAPLKHRLNVKLSAPSTAVRPGAPCAVEGVVTDHEGKPVGNAEVCLFAEDEGTLQVLGFKTPDPMRYFYDKRPLAVSTWTTLEQLLEEDWESRSTDNKGTFIGGGGPGAAADEPELRKDFNPCAVWLAALRTDENGRFKAEYVNPDTLTRYRVMAVALAGADCFGHAESAYVVNKPVMLEAAPPFSATVGDSLDIPVTVSQTENRAGQWLVTLSSANGVAEAPLAARTMTLEGNQPKTVVFNVKFKQAGEAKLVWSICPADESGAPLTGAEHARLTDRVEHGFTVAYPVPELREMRNFMLTAGKTADVTAMVKGNFYPNTSLTVTLGTSPLIHAAGSVDYLLKYPYGCLEQLSSAALPWVYEPLLSRYLPGFKGKTSEERARVLNRAVNKILKNMLPSGALSYWAGGKEVSEYCSYAALALTLAKEQGVAVPEYDLKRLYAYLEKSLNEHPDKDLLAAWVLARAEALSPGLTNRLLDKEKSLSDEDRLYLALALAQSSKKEHKARALELSSVDLKGRADAHMNLLLTLTELSLAPADSAVQEKVCALIVDRMAASGTGYGFYSTWGSGWDMILVGEYLKVLKQSPQNALVSVNNDGQVTQEACSIDAPALISGAVGKKLSLTMNEQATVYGSLAVKGRVKTRTDAAVNKGFAVFRVYEKLTKDGKWTPCNEFAVGDLVRITLHVDKGVNPLKYVVMEDYLPAAFEAVNPELTSQLPVIGTADEPPAYFSWNSWVSHREFLKDRVRFFADSWQKDRFTARYMARVVKAGEVIAPAAKAELMYKPATYGWSIPQTLKVKGK